LKVQEVSEEKLLVEVGWIMIKNHKISLIWDKIEYGFQLKITKKKNRVV